MKLVVGLGNPGQEYANTRHNVGFMCIDYIAKKENIQFNKEKFSGKYAELCCDGEKYIFLKPQKYMNLSGEVVRDFVNYFKIDISNILVINDDLDMDVGKIKLKEHGSSGGHNGLKNIELNIKTDKYKRIKVGISKDKNNIVDYVLGKFSNDDQNKINLAIKTIYNIFLDYKKMDFSNLMNKYNRK